MRLYLLPISTRRTLLYCQKFDTATTQNKTLIDKGTTRAAQLWASWEKKDKGWQKTIVTYGNSMLRRIPYEEWGLKSVPPLSTRRREDEMLGKDKVEVVYPDTVIPTTKALSVLQTLATERESLHKKRLIWCFVGMPISAPFALVPVIPNLPFFYLVYRAWSHWRAFSGGKHLQFLSTNNLLSLSPSSTLAQIYPKLLAPTGSTQPAKPAESETETLGSAQVDEEEKMLLSQASGRELFKALDIPELEVEVERAIGQVEADLEKRKGDENKDLKNQALGTEDAEKKEK